MAEDRWIRLVNEPDGEDPLPAVSRDRWEKIVRAVNEFGPAHLCDFYLDDKGCEVSAEDAAEISAALAKEREKLVNRINSDPQCHKEAEKQLSEMEEYRSYTWPQFLEFLFVDGWYRELGEFFKGGAFRILPDPLRSIPHACNSNEAFTEAMQHGWEPEQPPIQRYFGEMGVLDVSAADASCLADALERWFEELIEDYIPELDNHFESEMEKAEAFGYSKAEVLDDLADIPKWGREFVEFCRRDGFRILPKGLTKNNLYNFS